MARGRSRRRRGGPRRRITLAAAVLLAAVWWLFAQGERQRWPRAEILDAIRYVESGGRERPPDGDGGLAIGPYQIHEVYWLDALSFRPELGGSYQDCRNRAYAERVLAAYMQKYAADAWASGDAERIARVHNGGPKGHTNPKTDGYWRRVRERLP